MSKPYAEFDEADREMCKDKREWLKPLGFRSLPDQPTPRLIHPDLPGEVFDVYDLNPLLLVKKIYDLGEASVNKILNNEVLVKNPKAK